MDPKIPNLASTILFRENRVDISNSAILYASERPLSVMTDSEYRYLKHTAVQNLEGQKGELYFEFLNDRLQAVRYDFSLEGDYETWFQRQIDSLTDLYGEESVKEETENEELGFETVLYKWDYENTSLQVVLTTGEDVKPAATIGVILLED